MDSLTQRLMPHRYRVAVPQDCLDDLRERVDAAWMVSTAKRANAGYLPNGYDS